MVETRRLIQKTEVVLRSGDITKEAVDVIVNAANSSLMGGGGVDGAIHRAGGPAILEECREIRRTSGTCPPGEAVITTGGKLPVRNVIHTVGPVWHGGGRREAETLASAYANSLKLASQSGAKSVSFPSISTGAYGYPVQQAADVALSTIKNFCLNNSSLKEIRMVLFDQHTLEAYIQALERITDQSP